MDDTPHAAETPPGWLEVLDESEAELAAGQTVPSEAVHQRIRDSLIRIEAKRAAASNRGVTLRR